MKISMRRLVVFPCAFALLLSCNKENKPASVDTFYMMKVNGELKRIRACGTTAHIVQYLADTAVFAAFGCGGERAGFYLKGRIQDGSYVLNDTSCAWYDLGAASYQTDGLNKGTLTIRSRLIELANGGYIPVEEGEFSFSAVDKNTGQRIKVTDGKYLLEKY
jgi:hypothetical protein